MPDGGAGRFMDDWPLARHWLQDCCKSLEIVRQANEQCVRPLMVPCDA
jgi:hypothetical protein